MNNEYIAGMSLALILKDKKDLVGAEIGVDRGVTSEFLLKNLHIARYYCIDPWQPYGIENKNAGSTALTREVADSHYQETWSRVSFAVPRVIILNMTSEKASKYVADASLDFIFIDGDHSYEMIKQDLNLWFPKVKKDGIFAGHDFSHGDVNKALKEFVSEKYGGSSEHQLNLGVNDLWHIRKN